MNPREAPRSDGVAGFPEMSLSHFPLWKPRLYLRGKPCQRFPGYHWVAISSSWGILPTQGSHTRPFCVSCTGRRILYHRATWEATREVQRLGGENPLKEEMASPLPLTAWKAPWAEAPGGLQSMGLAESDRPSERTLTLQEGGGAGVLVFCAPASRGRRDGEGDVQPLKVRHLLPLRPHPASSLPLEPGPLLAEPPKNCLPCAGLGTGDTPGNQQLLVWGRSTGGPSCDGGQTGS